MAVVIHGPHVPTTTLGRETKTNRTYEQMLALMPEKDRHRIRFLVDAFCELYRNKTMTVLRRDS